MYISKCRKVKYRHHNGKVLIRKPPLSKRQYLSDKEIFKVYDERSPRGSWRSSFIKNELFRRGIVKNLNKCMKCKRKSWMGEELRTDLHHKNGNKKDCRLQNLEILCPNCHRFTDTYALNKTAEAA